MPNASQAEIYFIAAMFLLIIAISGTATYFFFSTYKKEQSQKRNRIENQKSKVEK
jgi:flagellar basal body-associated protein FliL